MKIVLSKCSFWCIDIALYLKLEKDKLPLSGTLLLVLPKWQKFLILIGLFKTAHQWATFTFFSVCASENSWWIASYFLNKMTGNWKFVYFLFFFFLFPLSFFLSFRLLDKCHVSLDWMQCQFLLFYCFPYLFFISFLYSSSAFLFLFILFPLMLFFVNFTLFSSLTLLF